ncbi:hypothetical protein [Oceaniglobus ichthyenteri]|uniref:hypothetical protein n=1 Tax=Oceaniglobus ichthyenteri TaxID=2136177 RepID=UPI000D35FA78|nr:hypothetical protein [Oceaniglobus ichthyenteri]
MADISFQERTTSSEKPFVISSFLSAMGAIASAFQVFRVSQDCIARSTEIAALDALSDEDLAARGITREQIVHHVYADFLAH